MEEITNKVANSGIVSIDLEEFYVTGERVFFDIKPYLFQELILREKDFREFIKQHDWSLYHNKVVSLICTVDAIVPTWAYMLLSIALEPHAKKIVFANPQQIEEVLFAEAISIIDIEKYRDARIVIKGCGEKQVPINAYVQLTNKLKPVAKSIMYGEPCSTVPLYKAKN